MEDLGKSVFNVLNSEPRKQVHSWPVLYRFPLNNYFSAKKLQKKLNPRPMKLNTQIDFNRFHSSELKQNYISNNDIMDT